MLDQHVEDSISRLPCWSGPIQVEPLAGGITNRNFKVTDRTQRYVVRLGQDIPEHGVMRFHELAAAKAAHAAGISPEVLYAAPGFLVSHFIDGATMTPEQIRRPQNLAPLIDVLRHCHRELPRHFQGPTLMFWVFQVNRQYLEVLAQRHNNPYAVPIYELRGRNDHLERALGPVTIVFGHNDLLAANWIDDGARLWLIDWDYAGFNSPLFDLANLATNSEFAPEHEEALLAAYFGSGIDANLRRGFAAMKCASLLRESLWGAVSSFTSKIDFDYAHYAREHAQRFEHRWQEFTSTYG
jgi:thiamine kinase-like enzyme